MRNLKIFFKKSIDKNQKTVYTINVKRKVKGDYTMTKATITERINAIALDTLTEEDFAFLKERALKSVHKASGERKPTKAQKENEGVKAQILEVLGEGMTATQVGEAVGISQHKASALLTQLKNAGQVVREQNGKQTIFKVAE